MLAERFERALGHGVDREGRRERFHIKCVGGFWILGAGAGPKEALRAGAGVGGTLKTWRGEQVEIGFVGALRDGDTEPIGQFGWDLSGSRDIPAADKERRDRGDGGIEAG